MAVFRPRYGEVLAAEYEDMRLLSRPINPPWTHTLRSIPGTDMAEEGLSASRMAQAKRVVSAVLSQAVTDGLIGRDPASVVKVQRTVEREPVI